jgi:hypothetical protein
VWEVKRLLPQVGQKQDTFCLDKGRIHYLGVYECLEEMTLPLDNFTKIGAKVGITLDYAANRR